MNQAESTAFVGRSLQDLWPRIVAYLPGLVIAAGVLVAGWLVARTLRWLTRRLITRLTRYAPGRAVERELRASRVEQLATEAISRVVFWAVFLFFVAIASEVLGLEVVSLALSRLAEYLPSVLASVLIVVAGIVLGNVARRWIVTAAASAGIAYAEFAGQLVRGAIWLVAAVVALDQIGIESTLLILTVAILVGTAVGSAALAFALGARNVVSESIALHYIGQSYRVGDTVRIGELRGRIVEFTRTAVLVDTEEGRALVPAAEFGSRTSILLGRQS